MNASERARILSNSIKLFFGLSVGADVALTLVRCERILHNWHEEECGNGNDFASWAIERDETTGKPYRVTYPHTGKSYRTPVPDRERAAEKRIKAACASCGLSYYVQTDPRGSALYVSTEPMTDNAYSSQGIAC